MLQRLLFHLLMVAQVLPLETASSAPSPDTGDVLTEDEMRDLLTEDQDRLAATRAAWETAAAEHRNIDDHVRWQFHTEEGRDGARAEALARLEAAERDALAAAEDAQRNAYAIRRQLDGADRERLSDDDLKRASLIRDDVRDDVERLGLVELRDAVRAAIIRADRAAMSLYLRFLPRRQFTDDDRMPAGAVAAETELRQALQQIRESLRDPSLVPLQQQTLGALEQAQTLHASAGRRRASAQRYAFVPENAIPLPPEEQAG